MHLIKTIVVFLLGVGATAGMYLSGVAQRLPDLMSEAGQAWHEASYAPAPPPTDGDGYRARDDSYRQADTGFRGNSGSYQPADGSYRGDDNADGPEGRALVMRVSGNQGCPAAYRVVNHANRPVRFLTPDATSDRGDGHRSMASVEIPPGRSLVPDRVVPTRGCPEPVVGIELGEGN